jgi:hypothetical protein
MGSRMNVSGKIGKNKAMNIINNVDVLAEANVWVRIVDMTRTPASEQLYTIIRKIRDDVH